MQFARRFLSLAIAMPVLGAASPPPPVPADIQQRVIAHFSDAFVLPDTAIWKFDGYPPFPEGGNVACGRVNYQDSTKAYIGYRGFFAVIRGPNIDAANILPRFSRQDPTGAATATYHQLCDAVTPKPD